ncbi:MAG: FHA domain-containing protein [Ectothiorhodospiraceae bacterium]|nr:FHA domain-containing protein [Ectothiorhodospiraceae bacterium]
MQPRPRARLTCLDPADLRTPDGAEIALEEDTISFGRGKDNDVVLRSDGVSRHHARVVPDESHWVLEDLDSTNGVTVNDEKTKRAVLADGDVLAIGKVRYRFSLPVTREPSRRPQISLSDTEKTMILNPGEQIDLGQPPAASRPAEAPAARPTPPGPDPDGTTDLRARATTRRAPPPAPTRAGGSDRVIMVAGLVIALVIAAATFLLTR